MKKESGESLLAFTEQVQMKIMTGGVYVCVGERETESGTDLLRSHPMYNMMFEIIAVAAPPA